MSVLRTIENTIEGLVERTFGRAFRSHLQPVELARKLAREMEQNKTVSVSQVYVPNEYTVYLAPADRERFGTFEGSLTAELSAYLAAYANSEGLSLLSDPLVLLETDTDLRVGEFGISCRTTDYPGSATPEAMAAREQPADDGPLLEGVAEHPAEDTPDVEPDVVVETPPASDGGDDAPGLALAPQVPTVAVPPVPAPPVAPPIPTPPAKLPPTPPRPAQNPALQGVSGTQILSAADARAAGLGRESLALVIGGRRTELSKRVTSLGRSKDNDVVLTDPNASRRHAEIRHVGLDYFLVDLDSTNGLQVNGQKSRRHALSHGDVITIGTTEIHIEAR